MKKNEIPMEKVEGVGGVFRAGFPANKNRPNDPASYHHVDLHLGQKFVREKGGPKGKETTNS